MSSASLDLFFNPKTVALIGASENQFKSGGMFLHSFITCELKSELFLVNPKGGEIRGLKVYPSVLDVPEEIDLAIRYPLQLHQKPSKTAPRREPNSSWFTPPGSEK